MNKDVTSNTSQSQQTVCPSCKEPITPNLSDANGNSTPTSLCEKCQKAKKNRKKAIIAAILISGALVVGTGWWYLSGNSKQRSALGFGEIAAVQDSVKVEARGSEKVSFDIASAAISSKPVSTQNPVSNIEDFHRVVAENTEAAKGSGSNVLSVPTTALLFQLGSDKISQSSSAMIRELTKFFKGTNQKATILVEGFACNLGDKEVNDYISQQRANAVKEALTAEGIDPSKIKVQWYGKSRNKEFQLSSIEDYRRVLISFQ